MKISWTVFAALQVALVVLWSQDSVERTSASIATAALTLISSLVLLVLSYFEHTRAVQPSTLISVYLLLSLLFNAARTRTLWQMEVKPKIAGVFSASLVMNTLLLILESLDKSKSLFTGGREYGPEETGGFIDRSLFFWMNRLIYTGYRRSLTLNDMHQLPSKFADGSLQVQWKGYWSKGMHVCFLI